MGHEGRGSLLSLLKQRGWATELSAGVGEGGYDRSSVGFLFDVEVTLTEEGLHAAPGAGGAVLSSLYCTKRRPSVDRVLTECYRIAPGCGLAVVGVVFEYLALITKAGPQRCVVHCHVDHGQHHATVEQPCHAHNRGDGFV